LTIAACLATGVSAASCSSAPSPPGEVATAATVAPASAQSLAAVKAAAAGTQSQTAQVAMRLAATTVFGVASQPITGTGSFDFRAGRGSETLNEPSGVESVIFEPASLFVRQPPTAAGAGTSGLPRGKSWISAGLTESPSLGTNFPQFVVQAEGTNPVFLLDLVAWGAVSAAPIGRVAGAPASARGFVVDVDLARAQTAATGPSGPALARAIGYEIGSLATGASTSAKSFVVRVWVDGSKVVELAGSPPGSGVGVTTMSLSSFGTSVHVDPPPSSKVADIVSLSPGGERENRGGGDSDGA